MKASEIINDLVGGKIKLSQAMQFARLLLLGSEHAEDLAWVTKECNGYDNKLHVPDYRQIPCQIFADYSLLRLIMISCLRRYYLQNIND